MTRIWRAHQAKQAQTTKSPIVIVVAAATTHALPNLPPGLVAEHSPFAPHRGARTTPPTTRSKISIPADRLPKLPLDPAEGESAGEAASSPGLEKVDGPPRRPVLVAGLVQQRLSCTCLPMELQDGRDSNLLVPVLHEDIPSSPLYPLRLYLLSTG
ncbi:hypothetical protein C358_00166 [Cryptococcus neoformans MW-RSA852]|nr:hypothetical protein C358_00166 [Cryptococcus neoformans var. grubii MW-RSA852]